MANLPPVASTSPYRPDPQIASLSDFIGDAVAPAIFPLDTLRFRNDRWAGAVGLGDLADAQWLAHFARFEPLTNNLPVPLALRYHGHQFRVYNPDIGDGRGFLFAQLRDGRGRLLDLATKGSGQTPYSRFGDGRLTLKGAVREILATEMLEALGVETSKTLSVIETGESLARGDEPSPTRSAVLVRLGHSHIRIGSFQRLAALGLEDEMRKLLDWCLDQYYPNAPRDNPAAALLAAATAEVASTAGRYMVAGFVHGVLNSDNIAITGESFDYGPWRFAPRWDDGFTAAYFDQNGLYAFGRQAEAMHWNLGQLAIALRLISDATPLIEALHSFEGAYRTSLTQHFMWRLGWASESEQADAALLSAARDALRRSGVSLDDFYHDWMGRPTSSPAIMRDDPVFADFRALAASYKASRTREGAYWNGRPCAMQIGEVEAIWAAIAERDDWSVLEAKLTAIRAMGDALRDGYY